MADDAARRVSRAEGHSESADALAEQHETISFADALPDLSKLHERGRRFDLVMLTAV
jgi:hypothetical protein